MFMKNIVLRTLLSSLLLVLLQSCQTSDTLENTFKYHPDDPFQKTMVKSQFFELNAAQDNVVEGKNGTLLVFPQGCFVDAGGKTMSGKVKVELAEAFSLDEMLLSNLTTTSDGTLLETDGMIYFNATSNGKQIQINNDNPVYIEIPTPKKLPGMMAYKGTRDAQGGMNWTAPKPLETFLVPVNMHLLDFLPKGFEYEVLASMPFGGYQHATRELTDSLYYSLSVSNGSEWLVNLADMNVNEPLENTTQASVNYSFSGENADEETYMGEDTTTVSNCGIDPAIIQAIRSEKFQQTFIATREFEIRLQAIFPTCRNDIIEIYINNTDKNLWESDSLAVVALQGSKLQPEFQRFFQMKQTNLYGAGKYAALLREYYEQRLSNIKMSLEAGRDKAIRAHREKNKSAQKLNAEYRKLLRKREAHRMETYGFEWTETGWVNIDRGVIPKDFGWEKLELVVQKAKDFERVHTYVVYSSIQSLYRLNTTDGERFFVGNEIDQQMLMPKNQPAHCISIGYKNGTPYVAVQAFVTGSIQELKATLEQTTDSNLKAVLKAYDQNGQENSIEEDLERMALLELETKRQTAIRSDVAVINRLYRIAYPCCASEAN
jgi:hypothetical protein